MNLQRIYQELVSLAEQAGISVKEENLNAAGIRPVKSGLCLVKNQYIYLLDKKKGLSEKIDLLLDCLCSMDFEEVHMLPVIRDMIEGRRVKRAKSTN